MIPVWLLFMATSFALPFQIRLFDQQCQQQTLRLDLPSRLPPKYYKVVSYFSAAFIALSNGWHDVSFIDDEKHKYWYFDRTDGAGDVALNLTDTDLHSIEIEAIGGISRSRLFDLLDQTKSQIRNLREARAHCFRNRKPMPAHQCPAMTGSEAMSLLSPKVLVKRSMQHRTALVQKMQHRRKLSDKSKPPKVYPCQCGQDKGETTLPGEDTDGSTASQIAKQASAGAALGGLAGAFCGLTDADLDLGQVEEVPGMLQNEDDMEMNERGSEHGQIFLAF